MSYFHSVNLDTDKCRGCTNCIKHCPTEAIRVRNGKARIIKERCIDCGECIRVCQYHAKRAVTDSFDELKKFKYTVALPAPALYGQFNDVDDINKILTGLKKIGFDDVFEVARGAEYITAATKEIYRTRGKNQLYISSACPAIIRLIRTRFPNLIDKIIDLVSPMEAAARIARKEAVEKTGLKPEEIGLFFITPCPAKMTSIKAPLAVEKSTIDGGISVNDVFKRLFPILSEIKEPEKLMTSSLGGVSWARSGGEAEETDVDNHISVDGVEDVIKILEEVEDDKVYGVNFIELSACRGGCVGGVLNVINHFVAKNHLTNLMKNLDIKPSKCDKIDFKSLSWSKKLAYSRVFELSDDFDEAMDMMDKIEEINSTFPQLDCGSCGAPSCKALAEDIVRGFADKSYCIVNIKERVQQLENDAVASDSDRD